MISLIGLLYAMILQDHVILCHFELVAFDILFLFNHTHVFLNYFSILVLEWIGCPDLHICHNPPLFYVAWIQIGHWATVLFRWALFGLDALPGVLLPGALIILLVRFFLGYLGLFLVAGCRAPPAEQVATSNKAEAAITHGYENNEDSDIGWLGATEIH